jgi:hypothetical protein
VREESVDMLAVVGSGKSDGIKCAGLAKQSHMPLEYCEPLSS